MEKRGARAAGARDRRRSEAKGRECGLSCGGQLQPGVLAARRLRVRLPRSSREAGAGDSEKWQVGWGRGDGSERSGGNPSKRHLEVGEDPR